VVGIDGSSSAASALDTAAAEALALGVPLRIVHAYVWPIFYASLANVPYRSSDWEPAPAITATVDATARRVASEHPGLVVQTSVLTGGGGVVLVEASADASLVVLGGRGVGGLAGLLAGSVAPYVASHAHCPVIVVRNGQTTMPAGGHVSVGVDGTPSSLTALRFACEWASRRGAAVEALHAVEPDLFDEPAPELDQRTPAEVRLDRWVGEIRRDFPAVDVRPVVVRASAADALMEASRSARLVVVGSRHRGEVASLVLGSVGFGLIRRSACPVAVVHGVSLGSADATISAVHDSPVPR
jgi:nucleotide-binding universal stress UspA family protein